MRVPEHQVDQISALARARRCTVSDVLRDALTLYLSSSTRAAG